MEWNRRGTLRANSEMFLLLSPLAAVDWVLQGKCSFLFSSVYKFEATTTLDSGAGYFWPTLTVGGERQREMMMQLLAFPFAPLGSHAGPYLTYHYLNQITSAQLVASTMWPTSARKHFPMGAAYRGTALCVCVRETRCVFVCVFMCVCYGKPTTSSPVPSTIPLSLHFFFPPPPILWKTVSHFW